MHLDSWGSTACREQECHVLASSRFKIDQFLDFAYQFAVDRLPPLNGYCCRVERSQPSDAKKDCSKFHNLKICK